MPSLQQYVLAGVTALLEIAQSFRQHHEMASWDLVIGLSEVACQTHYPADAQDVQARDAW